MTNLEIIELFLSSNNFTDDTKRTARNELTNMFKAINNIECANITMSDLEVYKLSLIKKDLAKTTYNKKINYLRMFVKYLVGTDKNQNIDLGKFGMIFKNEKTGSSLTKGDKPMLKEEYIPFVTAILKKRSVGWQAQRQKVVVLLMATCYLRRIEVQFLRKDDIDHNNLTVFPSKTKGDKPRRVKIDLNDKVATEIQKLYDFYEKEGIQGDYVILNRNGSHLKDASEINSIINGKNGNGGISAWAMRRNLITEVIKPHGLRKSGAVYLRHGMGYDIEFVRDLLGHESVTTTERYTAERVDEVHSKKVSIPL